MSWSARQPRSFPRERASPTHALAEREPERGTLPALLASVRNTSPGVLTQRRCGTLGPAMHGSCTAPQSPPLAAHASLRALRRRGRAAQLLQPRASAGNSGRSCFSKAPHRERGLLPVADPPLRLDASAAADAWEEALTELPKLLLAGRVRRSVLALPPLDAALLVAARDERQLWRAHLLLSFLAHAYVWGEGAPPAALPAQLAVPWCAVSAALDVPPILTYADFNLLNWRRVDAAAPVELGNIVCLNNFCGGQDEEWFRLVHVAIEARAGDALCELEAAQVAAAAGDAGAVRAALERITATVRAMQAILARMTERCDPYIYYQRVRWPMAGWRSNAALPTGLFYEGVGDVAPRQLYGETGAQSAVVPALDAALGVTHGGSGDAKSAWLSEYLTAMRAHMPREQRAFLAAREAATPLRAAAAAAGPGALRESYDAAVAELAAFRGQHRTFAAQYISKHAPAEERGTGGSAFGPALAGYQRHTAAAALGGGVD